MQDFAEGITAFRELKGLSSATDSVWVYFIAPSTLETPDNSWFFLVARKTNRVVELP